MLGATLNNKNSAPSREDTIMYIWTFIFPTTSFIFFFFQVNCWKNSSRVKFLSLFFQVCVTFVFGALLEYALVNYASRSDAQRLAKKKVQKQWELDHCSFDPTHMEDAMPPAATSNNGGSFAMVSIN